jgi:multisubunit Na+/H+ antiporter MnhB subunit
MKFHLFVLVSTILYFIVLRSYKKANKPSFRKSQKQSNFIYLLFVPVILYIAYYFFLGESGGTSTLADNYNDSILLDNRSSNISENLLSSPFPNSLSS